MRTRAYRARLSLTPDELEAVHAQVTGATRAASALTHQEYEFWSKLLGKVERARERGGERFPLIIRLPEDSNETD